MLFGTAVEQLLIFPGISGGASKIHRMIHENDPQEVPILGSSRASGCYIPSLIHPHAWNYGIEGTEYDVVEVLLKHELAKQKKTPIIINYDFEFFEPRRGDITNYLANLGEPDVRALVQDTLRWFHSIDGLRYFGHLDHYLKFRMGEFSKGNLVDKGAVILLEPFDSTEFAPMVAKRASKSHRWTPDSARTARFLALLQQANGRRVFLVIAPNHKSYYAKLENLPAAENWLKSLQSAPNLTVLDFSHLDYPDSMYLNTSHLNYAGARKFSLMLRDTLGRLDPDFAR